ncbi:FAD:protein FMN transferase [Micrococcus sp. ACRRV]|uniref:FAD:protein FMN transferase n=1 Tax=Micrococcus sp. ACRRV TaxID=2918203 RepID=UPI001EF3CC54|nr:FAD:protein FMN transferase [Micrococcus sp. ACRRV]MCG7422676.1 FAD:protein FMN transferase [Micrococcus sp. ACRRV]
MDAAQLPSFLTSGTVEDLLADAAAPAWGTRAFVEQVMGGPVSVHVRAEDPRRADIAAAVRRVWDLLHRIDAVLSPWRTDSDLLRMRRGELDAAAAHPWLAEVRALTDESERVTGGLFTTDLPAPDGSRGWDPTGLVKGWAGDLAAQVLAGVPGISYAVNAAGDVRVGVTPGGPRDPWEVGVEDPARPGQMAVVVSLVEGALATSGTAARGAHVMDPRVVVDGHPAPATPQLTSVSVLGPTLTWADAWATASLLDPGALAAAGPAWAAYRVVSRTV